VDRKRRFALVGIATLALFVVVFPPWQARAIRTTTRYAGVPGVTPSMLIDTLRWAIAFAPLYSPPRAALPGQRMQELANRSLSGDTAAETELRRSTERVERDYHAPEVLRTAGALWRDSILARAGIPAVTSYDLTFAIDQRWMAARFTVLAILGFVFLRRRSGPNLPA
jgi:hypothetical protein